MPAGPCGSISNVPSGRPWQQADHLCQSDGGKDGAWLETAGLALVRQRPGSAKGVLFVTIEDETDAANLILWPTVFERLRRTVLSAGMIAVKGPIRCEGGVVHLIVQRATDLSNKVASVGEREAALFVRHGRGDQTTHGESAHDPRGLPLRRFRSRGIYVPDLHVDTIKPRTRNFS
jgi:error-prone DNA polymerase